MKFMLTISLSATIIAGQVVAQTPDAAAWRPDRLGVASSLIPMFIQQDMGRYRDGDRMPPGAHVGRDEGGDHDMSRGHGRAGGTSAGSSDPVAQGHPMMRPAMGGMARSGGARFSMRKGDAAIDVRCPADVRLDECIEAIGRMLDRLSASSAPSRPGQQGMDR